MRIRYAEEKDQFAWDEYVLNHVDGLAYQLFAWKRAVKKAYGHDSFYLIAEKDSKICGVFPLIDFKIPFLGSSLISLPYCDAGGLLADNNDIARMLLQKATLLAKQSGAKCHVRATQVLHSNCANATDKVRMVLTLPENSDIYLASLRSKTRNKIKKALKNGYEVKVGSSELLGEFYSVFAENMHDLGSPVHSHKWIEAIVSEYKEKARVFVVFTPEGVPVAAGIILLHPTTVSNPWASSLRKYNHMKPNMLLYSALLSFAADNEFKQFDFGRSTPGEGTYVFKEQWGAKPSKLYWYEHIAADDSGNIVNQAKNVSSSNSGSRELAACLWQKLPVVGANWIGPRIRKYISL